MIVVKENPQCPIHKRNLVQTQGAYKTYYCCPWMPECDIQANYSYDTKQFYITNAEERRYRVLAHAAFDAIWKSGMLTRSQAYRMLRDHLKIGKRQCHIAQFDIEQCKEVMALIEAFVDFDPNFEH